MNTCINIKIKTKSVILDHLQATLSLPSRDLSQAQVSSSGEIMRPIFSLWKNQSNKLILASCFKITVLLDQSAQVAHPTTQ